MAEVAVLCLVTVAAGCDLAKHRIPNALVYPGWAVGFALGYATAGVAGLTSAALGFVVCFLPMFLLFVSGSLGGGDVKLMAGVGALLGSCGRLSCSTHFAVARAPRSDVA
jgi:prepilin peptidase CpaA